MTLGQIASMAYYGANDVDPSKSIDELWEAAAKAVLKARWRPMSTDQQGRMVVLTLQRKGGERFTAPGYKSWSNAGFWTCPRVGVFSPREVLAWTPLPEPFAGDPAELEER